MSLKSTKKALVISCKGLGDGVISMILSHNLSLNGYDTLTLHNGIFYNLQKWFPHLLIETFPPLDKIPELIDNFDKIFISYSSDDPFIQSLINQSEASAFDKVKVLNPSFSKKVGQQPFYSDAYFKPDISMVKNMHMFCKNILKLEMTTEENGIACPHALSHKKYNKRVVIHPTSAKKGRSWEKTKFLKLFQKLQKKGFDPCFIMNMKEKESWLEEEKTYKIKTFSSFDILASFLYESSYFIGNDSGIGHLASSLKIPVICISRSKRTTDLWKPGWGDVKVVYPPRWIPNISGFRFRDKNWQKFIFVSDVLRGFCSF